MSLKDKLSKDGPLPQLELGPHLGGFKVLYQRSGVIARMITMSSAMSAAWSTNAGLRDLFLNDWRLFALAAVATLVAWMVFDYMFLIPSEQSFRQGQAHRSERSPLKRDTEEIIGRLNDAGIQVRAADGGEDLEDGQKGDS